MDDFAMLATRTSTTNALHEGGVTGIAESGIGFELSIRTQHGPRFEQGPEVQNLGSNRQLGAFYRTICPTRIDE